MMKEDDPIAVFKTDIAEISDSEAVSVGTDDALLMSMGKKPELKRVYNFWTRKEISYL
jgi:choline transport protein